MSGTFRPVEVPDLGATLARVAQIDAMRQQTAIAQQTADQDRAFSAALPTLAPALASGQGPEYSRAIGTLMGMGQRGLALGLPLAQAERQNAALRDALGGGGAGPAPMATPVAMPAGGASLPPGDPNLPRGIRNNNPLNLTYVQGQPGVQGSDGRFGRYGSMEDGVAASVRQLQMYGQRGVNTVEGIIGRWAPPSENNTAAYVQRVAQALGVQPNAQIDLRNPEVVSRLVAVMAQHENGRPVPMDAVQRGVMQALGGGQAAPAGNTIPASAGAPAAAAAQGGGLTPDQRARVEALAIQGNEGARRALEIDDRRIARAAANNPEQYVPATETIGGRQVQGQRNTRTGQFTPFPGQTGADRPDRIDPATARAAVLRLGPRVAAGEIRPGTPEYDEYEVNYRVATAPQQIWVEDANRPGQQVMQQVPGLTLNEARFPPPQSGAYGAQPGATAAPAQGVTSAPAAAPGVGITGTPLAAESPSDVTPANPAPLTRQSPNTTPTGEENLSAGYARRMVEAEGLLERAVAGGYTPGNIRDAAGTAIGSGQRAGPVSRFIGNSVMSTQGQLYRQAQEDWVRAKLRRESGAVIGEEEMAREIQVYFPQPGDSPEVIAQKAQSRQVAMQAMRQASGRASASVPQRATPQAGQRRRVSTPAEAEALAPGTEYETPDGRVFRR